MRRAARTDANQKAIVEAARDLGFLVHPMNDELADLLVQFRGQSFIWECKMRKGKFTDLQIKRRAEGWKIRTVRTIADVIAARNEIF